MTTVWERAVCVLRWRLSVCEYASLPFDFEGWMWDLIVLVPDLAFLITLQIKKTPLAFY